MMNLYTLGDYAVRAINKARFVLLFKGEQVCKYDNTKDGRNELANDLAEFGLWDKLISTREVKTCKQAILKAVVA